MNSKAPRQEPNQEPFCYHPAMATTARRRGYGEDSIYFDAANNRWTGAVSLGFGPDGKRRIRRKVTGRTRTEVKGKLKDLRRELDSGIRSSPSYTMALCIEDWLSQGLTNKSPSTAANYRHLADHAVSKLGAIKLRELAAKDVQMALADLSGSLSTRSLRLVHRILARAIRHAQAADLVSRNVASLVAAPVGKRGRPSRSLTLDQTAAVLAAAEGSSLHAYVVLSLLAGLRTEELRSLLWTDVDLDAGTVAVYRSVRASGDTKTPKSRRVLKLPVKAADALRDQRIQQAAARLKAGLLWQDHGLVFASAVGTALDAAARRHRVCDRDPHRARRAGSSGGAVLRHRGIRDRAVPGGCTAGVPASMSPARNALSHPAGPVVIMAEAMGGASITAWPVSY